MQVFGTEVSLKLWNEITPGKCGPEECQGHGAGIRRTLVLKEWAQEQDSAKKTVSDQ